MRALVLGGGGAKGAFQAGALSSLLPRIQYDIVTGVSVGAINASFIAQYPISQSHRAAVDLSDMWHHMKPKDIMRLWYNGMLWKLPTAWKPSVYDSRPLHKTLEEYLSAERIRSSGRLLRVGAVSLTTGRYCTWTEQDEDIALGVAASSAFPVFMLPVRARGQLWMDGGARENTPVEDAILAGATSVDIIQCDPNIPTPIQGKITALKIAEAAISTALLEIDKWDIKVTELYNNLAAAGCVEDKQEITVRVLKPKHVLLDNPLNFDPQKISANFMYGLQSALDSGW